MDLILVRAGSGGNMQHGRTKHEDVAPIPRISYTTDFCTSTVTAMTIASTQARPKYLLDRARKAGRLEDCPVPTAEAQIARTGGLGAQGVPPTCP